MKRDGRIGRLLRGWREDYIYQTLISAAASFGCTALFALYNGYLGLWHRSVWHGSICVFYLLLMAIRGMVLLTEKRGQAWSEFERDRCRRRAFLVSSLFLLALDLALKLLRVLVENRGYAVPRATLVDRVWTDGAEYVEENALSVTVKRLRSKLEADPSKPEYLKTVYGIGYTWVVKS